MIDEAKQASRTSPRYVKGVIADILDQQGPVSYEEVVGVSTATFWKRYRELQSAAD